MAENESVVQEQPAAIAILKCTRPGCITEATADRMRVPAWDAMKAANGGRRVYARDLEKYVVCGKCGYRLKEEFGIRTFPFTDAFNAAVKREEEEAQAEHHRAEVQAKEQEEALKFKAFAAAFQPKGKGAAEPAATQAQPEKQRTRTTGKTAKKRAARLAAKRAAQPAAPAAETAPATAEAQPAQVEVVPAAEALVEAQASGGNGVAQA